MSLQIVRTCSSEIRATDLVVRDRWYLFCRCAAHECVTHELLKQFALLGRHVCKIGIGFAVELKAMIESTARSVYVEELCRGAFESVGRV